MTIDFNIGAKSHLEKVKYRFIYEKRNKTKKKIKTKNSKIQKVRSSKETYVTQRWNHTSISGPQRPSRHWGHSIKT